jgi:hypothetical protein
MKPDSGFAEGVESVGRKQPWDRRTTETRRAWMAFVLFRDSADRKLISVAKCLVPPCSVANISRWAARHSWQARTADYDAYMDQQHLAEIARDRVSARKRRLQVARALEGLGAHALKEWQNRIAAGLPLNLSMETIALLSKTGAALMDSALGPERSSKYTAIHVILGDAEPIPDAPNASSPAVLGDDADEGIAGEKPKVN